MSNIYKFRVHGFKKSGDLRDKTFSHINDALRFLWRIKEVGEIHLDAFIQGKMGSSIPLFLKYGRRRAINSMVSVNPSPDNRPILSKVGDAWRQLPTKYNDLD